MKEFTLRELCKECKVSRRAVQGYMGRKLIQNSGKTNRGYLLFDDEAEKKTKQIKALQNYGFTLDEIEKYYLSETETQKKMLEEKLVILKEKRLKMVSYIEEIKKIIDEKENKL